MLKMRKIFLEAVAFIVAAIGGYEVFFLVFAWPTFTSKHQDLMLIWGWIGWIPGGLVGIYVAGALWRLTRRILLSSAVSIKDYLYALIWLLALGVIAVLLINYGNVDVRWREQVRMLGYEEFLYLDRIAKGESAGLEGWEETEMSIKVVGLPRGWKSPPVWRKEYVPILLDYQPEGHVWSIVATFYYCDGWESLFYCADIITLLSG